jgi:hypothetical protein
MAMRLSRVFGFGPRSSTWDDRWVTRQVNRDRSLEELERNRWPAPRGEVTNLIARVHALRRKPLAELTVENLRMLIRQDVGLAYLLPLALEVLRERPMAEGDLYEGDLLSAVLTRKTETWKASPELALDVRLIVSELVDPPSHIRQEAARFLSLNPAGCDSQGS